uniref:(California timema) hypothetical protein n=1 Tax=Timema californicum TaxID=61474 RepID=A0A7R9JGR5_TIMCA|nr:unnamed protein product [Timema californicum]
MIYKYNTTETYKKHPTELRQYENEKKKLNPQNPRPAPQKRNLTMKEVLFKKTKLASNDPKAQSMIKSTLSGFVEFMANPNFVCASIQNSMSNNFFNQSYTKTLYGYSDKNERCPQIRLTVSSLLICKFGQIYDSIFFSILICV